MQIKSRIRSDCLVLMMNFMVFIQTRPLVHQSMKPHKQKIFHKEQAEECSQDLLMAWKTLQSHFGPGKEKSTADIGGNDYNVI